MRYCEYRPSARLARAVECVWTLEGPACERDEAPQPILPDGRAEFVIQLGDAFARVEQSAMHRQPWAIFAGPLDRPLTLQPTGRTAVLGVRFRPDGAARFTRVPQRVCWTDCRCGACLTVAGLPAPAARASDRGSLRVRRSERLSLSGLGLGARSPASPEPPAPTRDAYTWFFSVAADSSLASITFAIPLLPPSPVTAISGTTLTWCSPRIVAICIAV